MKWHEQNKKYAFILYVSDKCVEIGLINEDINVILLISACALYRISMRGRKY